MRALVFADYGRVEVDDRPMPTIQEPGDAIVRVTRAAICGSDLHVVHGRIPGMTEGSILGHEFVGVVEKTGASVTRWNEGDRVLASFIIPCGNCWYCHKGLFNRCEDCRVFGYGTFYGDVEGGQAEYVRVPNADICLHAIDPALDDESALFVGDIFSTGVDAAAEGHIAPGDTVVVQGCGPVGLMTIQAARAFSPAAIYAVDTVPDRLAMAERFGAIPVDASAVHVPSHIQDATDGRGADVVIECVGAIPAFGTALDSTRPGGRISIIGVYSEQELEIPLNITWVRGIDIKFCGVANIIGRWDDAFAMIARGEAQPSEIITHRLPLADAVRGYELFETREALKVVLTP